MAQAVQISGEGAGKLRSGWAVLGLNIITLGIYGIFWIYQLHRELRDIGRARGDEELGDLDPLVSTVSVYIGQLIIVPPFVTIWRLGGRIRRAQELSGSPDRIGQANTFLLVLPGALLLIPVIYWIFHVQRNHNSALRAASQGAAAIEAPAPVVTQAPETEESAPAPAPEGISGGDPLQR